MKTIRAVGFDFTGVLPEELVYIDDSEKSLSTAKEVGYTPILFTGKGALVRALEELGIQL